MQLKPILQAVRDACLPGLWSQGVKLAREGAVFGREDRADAIVVRVKAPGQPVAPTVTLYPDDAEWTCDCGGKVDPCAHIAAAAIAVSQSPAPGSAPVTAPASGSVPVPVPASASAPRIRYRLRRRGGTLALERWAIVPGRPDEPLKGPLAGRAAALHATHEDLAIDRLVGARQHGYYPTDREPELFAALAGARDVHFEDTPIRVSTDLIPPCATVRDHAGGAVLVIDRDPRITDVLAAGVARCGDTLHRLAETALTGPTLDRLPIRRVFARADLGRLVGEVLPDLDRRIPVDVQSRRLPRAGGRARPRIHLALDQKEHTLSVTPALVYGDPPEARIEDGRLIHLGGRVPVRDEAAERELLARLRDELHLVPGRRVDFDGLDAIRFAARLKAWDGADGRAHAELFGAGRLVPRFIVGDSTFDVVFELDSTETQGNNESIDNTPGAPSLPARRADAAAVLRAFQDGLPLAPLEGGGWAPLPADWLSRHGARVADLLAARDDETRVATFALPALAELCDELGAPRPAGLDRLAPMIDGFTTVPEAPLPADLTATLRPYQRRGADWLAFLRDAGLGAVLADDMGLGKTLQTLCALRGRALVVCPRSVVHNWADEIRRFRPRLPFSIYHGPARALDPEAAVTLTTYAVLRLDADRLGAQEWDAVVLDEAQAIKNPDSQAARAAYALRAPFRVALTGTPVENRLEELWSLMHFANRGLLGGRTDFRDRYERAINIDPTIDTAAASAAEAAARLRRRIRPFVLRRMKREVAPELPPRTESVLYCELDESERAVYDAVRAAARKEIVARLAEGASVLAALEALLRLRQAACHPALVPGQHAETSAKVERLLETLEESTADGHKALVFSQWTSLLDRVEPHLEAAGIPWTRLDGATRDRAAVVAAFQDPGGPPVMLLSLKAGGVGLNLTAADHVFLMDPWWNPAAEDQAADRAHRIGQDRPVLVHKLVAKDTVEEGILALQARKRAIAGAALGEGGAAAALTREDLLALLEAS